MSPQETAEFQKVVEERDGLLETKKQLLHLLEGCIGSLLRDREYHLADNIRKLLKDNSAFLGRVEAAPPKKKGFGTR